MHSGDYGNIGERRHVLKQPCLKPTAKKQKLQHSIQLAQGAA